MSASLSSCWYASSNARSISSGVSSRRDGRGDRGRAEEALIAALVFPRGFVSFAAGALRVLFAFGADSGFTSGVEVVGGLAAAGSTEGSSSSLFLFRAARAG